MAASTNTGFTPITMEYTIDQLFELEEESGKASQDHLFYALEYIVRQLEAAGTEYAVMGGLSMQLRGFDSRTTTDVDLAIDMKPRSLNTLLASDDRIYRPRPTAASTGIARVFVLTGPSYGEQVEPLPVLVDLILAGNLGAPRNIAEASTQATATTPWGTRVYKILDLQHILKAKLRSYASRFAENDYNDIIWMWLNLEEQVRQFSGRLDWEERDGFYNAVVESGSYTQHDLNDLRATLQLDYSE
ncbi:uncharacterized protein GGS22DRAFT_184195 [Annulohypoxylon maeteangense]|uniref:uncharacterized protein n=1 Tax=Annulohypoxylon maeteangense TaxID=1927788 RepID=UPI0020074097|nr:uncharacterized protein GGS22DRAFT_184195 [Annulohypoxylon maeteangense]KAI0888617.1 hypothetical protein GGS22DRAFT_184195 [Annulohypoxylon maeteangense]